MKKEFHWFTIWNYKKEEDYLRRKHQQGLRLVKVTGFGVYHFEECEPQDVIYRLDYNQEKPEQYLQLFADCGWDYIMQYGGYCYFRKPAEQNHTDEEIFNDNASRLAMLERVYKGRLIPLLVLFFACLLPQFITNLLGGRYAIAAAVGGILLVYLIVFLIFAINYICFKSTCEKS